MPSPMQAVAPVAKAEMLIRRPADEVFEAFVDPSVTSRFWFTRGSGRLEPGRQVEWHWDMYGFSLPVLVKAVDRNRRIVVDWGAGTDATTIEWTFTALKDGTTFVSIANSGFAGGPDKAVQQALDSTEGFAFVLAGLKALLEHNVRLNLVADRFPAGLGTAAT
jgi:uncharacterized protein YndB with AHSA1/START domain